MQISVETTEIRALLFLLTSNEVSLKSYCLSNRLLAKLTSLPENISDVSSFWRLSGGNEIDQVSPMFISEHANIWTQDKCLQILFFNNPNKFFCDF